MQSCPMTNANIELYSISDNQAQNFCKAGCSVACSESFLKKSANAKDDAFDKGGSK